MDSSSRNKLATGLSERKRYDEDFSDFQFDNPVFDDEESSLEGQPIQSLNLNAPRTMEASASAVSIQETDDQATPFNTDSAFAERKSDEKPDPSKMSVFPFHYFKSELLHDVWTALQCGSIPRTADSIESEGDEPDPSHRYTDSDNKAAPKFAPATSEHEERNPIKKFWANLPSEDDIRNSCHDAKAWFNRKMALDEKSPASGVFSYLRRASACCQVFFCNKTPEELGYGRTSTEESTDTAVLELDELRGPGSN